MENLIAVDLNSVNLANIDSDESVNVTFDQFKDVFFNLPFISEFIRASSGFTEESFEGLNRQLYMVKVQLSVGNNSRFFSFADRIVSIFYWLIIYFLIFSLEANIFLLLNIPTIFPEDVRATVKETKLLTWVFKNKFKYNKLLKIGFTCKKSFFD